MSAISGLGRVEVKEVTNSGQPTLASARKSWPCATARSSASSTSRGGIGSTPRRSSMSDTPSERIIPVSAHAPKATEVAASPRARRCWASASR